MAGSAASTAGFSSWRSSVLILIPSLVLGLLLGSIGFLFAWQSEPDQPAFGLVIALAILGICVWANGVGALVPLLASRLALDPALVSPVDAAIKTMAVVEACYESSAGGSTPIPQRGRE